MEIQNFEKIINKYSSYFKVNEYTECQNYFLIALEDKEVQSHFVNHINNGEIFLKCKCLPIIEHNKMRILFQFQPNSKTLSIIPPTVLAKINLDNKKVIEITDNYVDEFVLDDIIEDCTFSSLNIQIKKTAFSEHDWYLHSSGFWSWNNPHGIKAGNMIKIHVNSSFPLDKLYLGVWAKGKTWIERDYGYITKFIELDSENPIEWTFYIRSFLGNKNITYKLYSNWIPDNK